ncbi:MAG: hypothetical protein L0Z50_14010 [Verrucomicrobiales bacterium]|nr:hypothetical protein [Verrucomicrobiales bacterium]
MIDKFLRWLRANVRVAFRKPPAPSPLARKISKVVKILLTVCLCAFATWRIILCIEINDRFTSIRAAGFPASGAELNTWRPPVPDAENGALVLAQAFSLARTFPDGRSNQVTESRLLDRANEWTAETRVLIAEYVQTNTAAVAKAREAFRFLRFRYPADFSYGPETELPHLGYLKAFSRIVALRGSLEAEEKRANEWPQHVELLLKLTATLDDEPTLISHLVRDSIMRMAVKATERSLSRAGPAAEVCDKLQKAFSAAGQTNLLAQALIGERALMIPTFRLSWSEIQSFRDRPDEGDQPRKPQRYAGKPTPILWLSGIFERDLNFFLETMDKSIAVAAFPPPESLGLADHFGHATQIAERRLYFLSVMYFPALLRIAAKEAATQAHLDLARTALAIERFRHAKSVLPGGLDELTPQFLEAVPRDPFDGAPLRYHRLAKGYLIYSIDSDGRDDGGREPPDRKKTTDKNSYDITFIVGR